MWYFFNKFDNSNLDNLIELINSIFLKVFRQETYDYPDWMEGVKLKSEFVKFSNAFEISTEEERKRLIMAFEKNIQIENICNLDIEPVLYDELLQDATQEFVRCIDAVKSIQDYLYENLLKLKGHKETVGTLKNYYDQFYDTTIKFVCPFCGVGNMLTSKDDFREAFDHYLPRSKYPFVSLLRENIFPICHTCNSTYKGDKNLRNYGKVFYPFSTNDNDCEPTFTIRSGVIENLEINSDLFEDQIETWNEVFGIKSRIKNFADVNLNGWMSNIQEAMKNYNVDYLDAKNAEIKNCRSDKMQDHKFIKEAIYKAL